MGGLKRVSLVMSIIFASGLILFGFQNFSVHRHNDRVFDPNHYRMTYVDLSQMNDRQLAEHWSKHGIQEGRVGSRFFSSKEYLEIYPDLKAAFGANGYEAALNHYLVHGMREGRAGRRALLPPSFDYRKIKGLHTDNWPEAELIGNQIGVVGLNVPWFLWEVPFNDCLQNPNKILFESGCFIIDPAFASQVRNYHKSGVHVTAVVSGTPDTYNPINRSRNTATCSENVFNGRRVFCAPDDSVAFGRFMRFLASQFSDKNHAYISTYVIHNEVNSNSWYDVGCGKNNEQTHVRDCDVTEWVSSYADQFNSAYDAVKLYSPEAVISVPLTHYFSKDKFDVVTVQSGRSPPDDYSISIETFLPLFDSLVGDREWVVAHHPYSKNLFEGHFDADDLTNSGMVTAGNIGILAGWLRAKFPNKEFAWQLLLTESGYHSDNSAEQNERQSLQICQSYRNIVGTPSITQYIYNRVVDSPLEGGLLLGLVTKNDSSQTAKPSWSLFSLLNRTDIRGAATCGYENFPLIKLSRSYNRDANKHWISSRQKPVGFQDEKGWLLKRSGSEGDHLLYECEVPTSPRSHTILTKDPLCEQVLPRGPVGYISQRQDVGSLPLYRCASRDGQDHIFTNDINCEQAGFTNEELLGYVFAENYFN